MLSLNLLCAQAEPAAAAAAAAAAVAAEKATKKKKATTTRDIPGYVTRGTQYDTWST
jgi:NAD(P)H-hydrate repair Nnr-like enzyme with NAD(P)H-hydrate dehydratase domain